MKRNRDGPVLLRASSVLFTVMMVLQAQHGVLAVDPDYKVLFEAAEHGPLCHVVPEAEITLTNQDPNFWYKVEIDYTADNGDGPARCHTCTDEADPGCPPSASCPFPGGCTCLSAPTLQCEISASRYVVTIEESPDVMVFGGHMPCPGDDGGPETCQNEVCNDPLGTNDCENHPSPDICGTCAMFCVDFQTLAAKIVAYRHKDETGEWTYPINEPSLGVPSITNDCEQYACSSGEVCCLTGETGQGNGAECVTGSSCP